jgi:CubicO group peptidase (beta-lactamase class C family)
MRRELSLWPNSNSNHQKKNMTKKLLSSANRSPGVQPGGEQKRKHYPHNYFIIAFLNIEKIKIMKKTVLSAIIITTMTTASAQPSRARLDSLMNYYAKEYNFNGVALISYKGKVLLDKGYGYRDIAGKIKNDENTIFQIGSNTKQFTAEVILQLAMKKKMDLHDPLTKYFPKYPNGDKITIENLLTHTSGIFNYTEDTTWHQKLTQGMNMTEMMSLFENRPLSFAPGEKFEYSNSNYMLLGYIIEKVTGKKYEQVVRENILGPAGMTHSGFDYTNLHNKNKAVGYYTIQGDHYNEAPITDSTIDFAAGGLYSTAADLLNWHNALQSYKLLPKEWQEKAYVPFKGKYGYGWMIDTGYGKRHIGHSGGVPGFYTYVMRLPEDNACILLLQNCELPAMDNNTICVNIIKSIYAKDYKLPTPKKAIAVNPEVLMEYAGVYNVVPGFDLTIIVKKDELYAQGTDQPDFKMTAESATKFYNKEVGAEIEFKKDESGKVNQLVLSQGGEKIPASRK